MKVVVLHDNPEWFQPIETAMAGHGVTVEEWLADETTVNLNHPPPNDAVFYNRCSATCHTTGRPRSLDQAMTILRWLEQHQRVVVNGVIAAELENSKALQYMTAIKYGLNVPKSVLTAKPTPEMIKKEIGKDQPFLIKPDRGGRGTSVRLYDDTYEFEQDPEPLESTTGLYVVQEFISPRDGVYRAEFVGQRYLYTSVAKQNFSECFDPNMCPCDLPQSRFKILTEFSHPILNTIQEMFRGTRLENGAVEFIFDKDGVPRVIDINTNTGYNRDAEISAGAEEGWKAVTQYIVNKLKQVEQ